MDAELAECLSYYEQFGSPLPQDRLTELLREIQEFYGCIPEWVQVLVAERGLSAIPVMAKLIRLYPSLKSAPYRHRIIVCGGVSCAGGKHILEFLRKELHLEAESVTADGRFFLHISPCQKRCKDSPNLMINQDLYSNVEVGKISKILEKYE